MKERNIKSAGVISGLPGDPSHAKRRSGRAVPREDETPPAYHEPTALHRTEQTGGNNQTETDPILSLRGTGKALWADEDADVYVERLRKG